MGWLIAFALLSFTAVLLWRAFGPAAQASANTRVIGPDDDPDFLWKLDHRDPPER